ncbi:hypothetical protein BN2537_13867 [Streptomyces venezuelae]|nr:hypothetical protein BN2537_13867 [Streptomyces venezuelae]
MTFVTQSARRWVAWMRSVTGIMRFGRSHLSRFDVRRPHRGAA